MMKKNNVLWVVLFFLMEFSLKACSVHPEDIVLTENGSSEKKVRIEPIQDAAYRDGAVKFLAKTNGCTRSEHFVLEGLFNQAKQQCELLIYRTKADYCRRTTSIAEFSIAWQAPSQCDNTAIIFTNPGIVNFEVVKPDTAN